MEYFLRGADSKWTYPDSIRRDSLSQAIHDIEYMYLHVV